ncbi:MAG TPA: hypothetical protein VGG41_06060 [Solirubrobacteraceae bacterium]|jgi:hypothetical protein
MRLPIKTAALAGTLACVIAGASVALAAGSSGKPAGGPIQFLVAPGQNQGGGKIIFTGAVGDYGSSSPTTASGGKQYGTATLKKGTLKIDLTAISAKVASAKPAINPSTCSVWLTETAPAQVVSGTGLYAGIHGTVQITESFAFIGATYTSGAKKGQCNMSANAPTVAEMGTVYGSGSVSF